MWNPNLAKASVPLQRPVFLCKGTAQTAKLTSAACADLYTEASQCAATALQLFTRYHLLQHIPILLISNQFLQGYLSTWRG